MLTLSSFTGGLAQTNGFLVEKDGRTIVVDAPEGMAEWLEERAGSLELEALVLTHQHFDHVMDAAAVASLTGCPVLAFSNFSRELTLEALFGNWTGMALSVPEFPVTRHLAEGAALELLGFHWDVLHVPGHSPDSICLSQPALGLLFGGDVLMRGGVGRTDLPGGSFATLAEGIRGKILTLPDSTRVLPGHGPETTVGMEREGNPWLAE